MNNPALVLALDLACCLLSCVFLWSTLIVLLGLLKRPRRHPAAKRKLRFAVLVCARNEEAVIRMPVKSIALGRYPADRREVIVLADNCTDRTAERAWAAGATVWEKKTPSGGKGDVLAWGVERVAAHGGFDAIAVFDSDNIVADNWLDVVNDALQDGESVVTGRRHASNAKENRIAGWYAIYWDIMNELSNRVRTNLGLSAKLTGTGFAFLLSALGPGGWKTRTMVEDVEFTVQCNIAGRRVAYVPEADYADEQPVEARYMWRQLRRWATGGWQVARFYFAPWLGALLRRPSLRLFDIYFAILTGMSVAFVLLFDIVAFAMKLCQGGAGPRASMFFFGVLAFVCVMGWFTALASIGLSQKKRRPRWTAVLTFPVFSLVLSAAVLYTLVLPTRRWKPIPHIGTNGGKVV